MCWNIGNGGWGNNNFGMNPMMGNPMMGHPMMGLLAQERASAQTTGPAVAFAALGALVTGALTHRANPGLPSTLIGAAAAVGAAVTGWIAGGVLDGMARGNASQQYLNAAMMNGNGFNMMM